jgi:hypothetical protein
VYHKIIEELAKNYAFGMVEMPLDTLCSGVGYKHPRSDAFKDAIKLLKEDGLVEKKKGNCNFTDKAIKKYTKEMESAANPEEAMQQFWNQFEGKLKLSKKTSGATVLTAAKVMWDMLKDGNGYTKQALVDATSYNMERSTGFGEILKCFKELRFTETSNGKVAFTDKLFPFGRP